jgi:hypothetical protein
MISRILQNTLDAETAKVSQRAQELHIFWKLGLPTKVVHHSLDAVA